MVTAFFDWILDFVPVFVPPPRRLHIPVLRSFLPPKMSPSGYRSIPFTCPPRLPRPLSFFLILFFFPPFFLVFAEHTFGGVPPFRSQFFSPPPQALKIPFFCSTSPPVLGRAIDFLFQRFCSRYFLSFAFSYIKERLLFVLFGPCCRVSLLEFDRLAFIPGILRVFFSLYWVKPGRSPSSAALALYPLFPRYPLFSMCCLANTCPQFRRFFFPPSSGARLARKPLFSGVRDPPFCDPPFFPPVFSFPFFFFATRN